MSKQEGVFFADILDGAMSMNSITVFYDGGCRVCNSEVSHYKKISPEPGIDYININDPGFEPGHYGKSRDDFMAQLHVQDAGGNFHVGVEAFRLLWKKLPGPHYRLLASITGLPGINLLSRIIYRLFAENRHRLPRRIAK